MFTATLNRTLISYIKAIIGAEYILRWLPIGTHDWNKFLKPEELEACIRPQRDKIVTEPERVMLTEVNELAKQGGQVADLIEQVTTKTTKSISVKEND